MYFLWFSSPTQPPNYGENGVAIRSKTYRESNNDGQTYKCTTHTPNNASFETLSTFHTTYKKIDSHTLPPAPTDSAKDASEPPKSSSRAPAPISANSAPNRPNFMVVTASDLFAPQNSPDSAGRSSRARK